MWAYGCCVLPCLCLIIFARLKLVVSFSGHALGCEHWEGGGMMLRGEPLPGIIDYYAKVFFGSF